MTVSVDGVVYYQVQNAILAVANINNADAATRLLAQTTLRNVLGTKNLAEILSDREEIAHSMQVPNDHKRTVLTLDFAKSTFQLNHLATMVAKLQQVSLMN